MLALMIEMKIKNNKMMKQKHLNQKIILTLIDWFLQEFYFRKNIRFIQEVHKELKIGNLKFKRDLIIFIKIYKTKR
jgi:predicted MPP superfamily phosphohydrolase